MRIVFDYQIFSLQRWGGISRYFIELARMLPLVAEDGESCILAPLHINMLLASSEVRKIARWIPSFPGSHRVLPLVNRMAAKRLLQHLAPDILHETYYTRNPQAVSVPRVLTVYDMIHERFPEQFHGADVAIPELKRAAIARADRIIAISKTTARDLVGYLNIPESRISVIPLGHSFDRPQSPVDPVPGSRPYLLYVGLREGVKNFSTLVEAFAASTLLAGECDLCCVGGGPFTPAELEQFQRLGVSARIRREEADDGRLAELYTNALLFVYPSLYEGFGLPVLEAMQCGCPVVCSNTGSLPEIGGKAARYFTPDDVEELREAMETVAGSQAVRERMCAGGYERQKLFTWQRCAEETAALYRSLL